jgi:hypothetical protein
MSATQRQAIRKSSSYFGARASNAAQNRKSPNTAALVVLAITMRQIRWRRLWANGFHAKTPRGLLLTSAQGVDSPRNLLPFLSLGDFATLRLCAFAKKPLGKRSSTTQRLVGKRLQYLSPQPWVARQRTKHHRGTAPIESVERWASQRVLLPSLSVGCRRPRRHSANVPHRGASTCT